MTDLYEERIDEKKAIRSGGSFLPLASTQPYCRHVCEGKLDAMKARERIDGHISTDSWFERPWPYEDKTRVDRVWRYRLYVRGDSNIARLAAYKHKRAAMEADHG